jgi:hypothetical protein
MRIVTGVGRFWRKRGCRQLLPGAGGVAAPQLGPKMAEIERGIYRAVGVGQHRRDRVAEKLHLGDLPSTMAARQLEETFAGGDMEPICHTFLGQPPDNAWKT